MTKQAERPSVAEKTKPNPSAPLDWTKKPVASAVIRIPHPTPPAIENSPVRGRPATGKRSNPEWKLYSHFLRRHTQRAAVAKLQSDDDGRDLSDVLQELLENWLKA